MDESIEIKFGEEGWIEEITESIGRLRTDELVYCIKFQNFKEVGKYKIEVKKFSEFSAFCIHVPKGSKLELELLVDDEIEVRGPPITTFNLISLEKEEIGMAVANPLFEKKEPCLELYTPHFQSGKIYLIKDGKTISIPKHANFLKIEMLPNTIAIFLIENEFTLFGLSNFTRLNQYLYIAPRRILEYLNQPQSWKEGELILGGYSAFLDGEFSKRGFKLPIDFELPNGETEGRAIFVYGVKENEKYLIKTIEGMYYLRDSEFLFKFDECINDKTIYPILLIKN